MISLFNLYWNVLFIQLVFEKNKQKNEKIPLDAPEGKAAKNDDLTSNVPESKLEKA